MFKNILKLVLLMTVMSFVLPNYSNAQDDQSFKMKLESIIHSYKNYRFSMISVYKLKDIKDVAKIIKEKEDAEDGSAIDTAGTGGGDITKGVDVATLQVIERTAKSGASVSDVRRELVNRGMEFPPNLDAIYQLYVPKVGATKRVRNVYVVTTRVQPDAFVPNTLIAMILSYDDGMDLKKQLDNKNPSHIYTYSEMKEYALNPAEFKSENLYDLLMNAFMQGMVEDKTLEAQGIGTLISFFAPKAGVTTSLLSKDGLVNSQDIQLFKRISDGQALDMVDKFDEVIVSPDLISWRHYDYKLQYWGEDDYDTLSRVTNENLPEYGLELKYGADAINYPSFWSERLSVNALWQGVKLGVILPTNGWSSLSKDMYSIDRKLTYGGFGITGEADFPVAVIPKSGIFNASFAYVLGDAVEGPIKRKLDPDFYQTNPYDNDYLIRYNAQLHYTFAVAIDENYLLRFGLGGTIYGAESWYNKSIEDPETRRNEISYEKLNEETVGGISGRVEFMARKASTPFGMSAQYFDEGLYTNIWLQIPLIQNTFSLKLDIKGYFKAFSDEPRAWENESVFIPMARFIINF